MLHSVVFAAAAACLSISLPEGVNAGNIDAYGASSLTSQEQVVENGELEQHIQLEAFKGTSPPVRLGLGVALFALLSVGMLGLLKAVSGSTSSGKKTGGQSEQFAEGDAKEGKLSSWEAAKTPEEFAERYQLLKQHPRRPDPPVTLGPQQVIDRTKRMSQLLVWIAEADERGDAGDSAGGVLGHRLREAYEWLMSNKNAGFSADVLVEDIVKFKGLVMATEATLKRHYRIPEIWYEDASP